MPAQKRGPDAAEDDPVQDTQSNNHEHLEDAEGTSVTLASPKINLTKIFTTKGDSFAFAHILFRDLDCLFCLTLFFLLSESDRSPSSSYGDNKDECVLSSLFFFFFSFLRWCECVCEL
jgi:hypothetical protein